jgi:hypothetical protein
MIRRKIKELCTVQRYYSIEKGSSAIGRISGTRNVLFFMNCAILWSNAFKEKLRNKELSGCTLVI